MYPLRFSSALFALYVGCCSMGSCADLVEVFQLAESNDPQFKQILSTHRATLETLPQARALLYPSLSLTANSSSNDQSISTSGIGASGEIGFNSHGYSLDLAQPIFRWDRYLGLDKSEAQIQQSATNVESARQDLVIRVAERYFDVLRAKDNLEFAKAEEVSLKRQLEQAEQRFEVGLIAITDVQEAKAGHDRSIAGQILAENQLDNAIEALREITGEYTVNFAQLSDEMPLLTPQPEQIEQWTSKSLEQNLDVLAVRHETEVARQEIEIQKTGHYPTLDLVASQAYNSAGGRFGGTQTHTTSVGVELAVPIFQGGLVNSLTRQAYENYEASMQKFEQSRRTAQRETREAYLGVISGISQVRALQQAVLSSETALQSTEAGFEVGTRTAVDVVASERALLESRRDYSGARYDYLLDTLRLKQAVGTLSVEDLRSINSWLN
ncbi:MAG: TolC family outer membrane protein [Thiotrichales bacterium]|nr:TolC family outer membrane protein [Thiotrichales bacterium]